MSRFRNKYRIESFRLKNWDYRREGIYYITICTKNRIPYFGECVDGKMILSDAGRIAHQNWMEIPNHFPHVQLGEFIVMPNHMHGLLILDGLDDPMQYVDPLQCNGSAIIPNNNEYPDIQCNGSAIIPNNNEYPDIHCNESTDKNHNKSYLQNINSPCKQEENHTESPKDEYMSQMSPKSGSVSTIVRSYKSACTFRINKSHPDIKFGWQNLFYDRIVRNDKEYMNIKKYIIDNPINWQSDQFHFEL